MVIQGQPNVELRVVLELTEKEARALQALAMYGFPTFEKLFTEHLSDRVFREHKAGFESFFAGMAKMPALLRQADDARRVLENGKENANT
jgi:hypothetical protein